MHRSRSQAFPKKRLIQGGRRSVSGCLLAQTLEGSITGVWHWCWWTVEQKVTSVEGSETETQSHVALRAPYMASGRLAASMGSLSSRLYGFMQCQGQRKVYSNQRCQETSWWSCPWKSLTTPYLLELHEPWCTTDQMWHMDLHLVESTAKVLEKRTKKSNIQFLLISYCLLLLFVI